MRSILTLLSGMVAFLLFGVLQGADAFFAQFVSSQHLDVLVISNPAYLPMPVAYLRQIEAVPGVSGVSYGNETNGYFSDPKNGLAVLAYDASLFQVDQGPIKASPEDQRALAETPNGALISLGLAQRTGWKRGNLVSVHVRSLPQKNGSMDWQLRIVGFVELESGLGSASSVLLTNYDYIDRGRAAGAGTVMQFLAHIENPTRAGAISEAIDNLFVNSPVQTRTMSAKDLAQSLLARIGNIDFFLDSILAAVFFTLLLLVGNALDAVFPRTDSRIRHSQDFGLHGRPGCRSGDWRSCVSLSWCRHPRSGTCLVWCTSSGQGAWRRAAASARDRGAGRFDRGGTGRDCLWRDTGLESAPTYHRPGAGGTVTA